MKYSEINERRIRSLNSEQEKNTWNEFLLDVVTSCIKSALPLFRNQFNLSFIPSMETMTLRWKSIANLSIWAPSDWLMCSSRFSRRVSRQSASINYIFAFCASLIVFLQLPIVHAQHNDLYKMIKATNSSVMKPRNSNYEFSRWFSYVVDFFSFFYYFKKNRSIIFCSSLDGHRRWKLVSERD